MIAASKVYQGPKYTLKSPLNYFEAQTYGRFVHPEIQDFMRAVFTAYSEEGPDAITKKNLFHLYQQYVS